MHVVHISVLNNCYPSFLAFLLLFVVVLFDSFLFGCLLLSLFLLLLLFCLFPWDFGGLAVFLFVCLFVVFVVVVVIGGVGVNCSLDVDRIGEVIEAWKEGRERVSIVFNKGPLP